MKDSGGTEDLKYLQGIYESNLKSSLLEDFYLTDPVMFPKRFKKRNDIEAAAFIAAIFAIGPRYAIIRALERIFLALEDPPFGAISEMNHNVILKRLDGHIQFAYKNITGLDAVQILFTLKELILEFGTIQSALKNYLRTGDERTYNLLSGVLEKMKSYKIPVSLGGALSPRARALLASPLQGSACKRMNMYLRWMTREDEVDFGFYKWLGTENLIIPLDVNVSRAARKLKLTARKTDNWKTAVEITGHLKRLDPSDPVKYDIPLFLYGIELRTGRKTE